MSKHVQGRQRREEDSKGGARKAAKCGARKAVVEKR